MKKIFYLIPILLFTTTCDLNNQSHNSVDLEFFSKLDTQVSDDLNFITQKLKLADKNFSERDFVTEIVYQNFTHLKRDMFLSMYDQIKYKGSETDSVEVDQEVIREVNFLLKEAEKDYDPKIFKDLLDSKYQEVAHSDLSKRNKEILLTYIIIYKTSFQLLDENPGLILYSDESQKVMWKCTFAVIAGAIAGAGTGGVSGATIGGAIGKLFGKKGEVAGAGIGAIAGLIGGAIGGGLGGYVYGCDEE